MLLEVRHIQNCSKFSIFNLCASPLTDLKAVAISIQKKKIQEVKTSTAWLLSKKGKDTTLAFPFHPGKSPMLTTIVKDDEGKIKVVNDASWGDLEGLGYRVALSPVTLEEVESALANE